MNFRIEGLYVTLQSDNVINKFRNFKPSSEIIVRWYCTRQLFSPLYLTAILISLDKCRINSSSELTISEYVY
jgi:hypothetical protein